MPKAQHKRPEEFPPSMNTYTWQEAVIPSEPAVSRERLLKPKHFRADLDTDREKPCLMNPQTGHLLTSRLSAR
jgi:hypothetical protein